MFILRKTFRFEASHQLMKHDGKCARLHGHSWQFTVELAGVDLVSEGPKAGMLFDYGDVSKVVKPIIEEKLDHWHLNATLATDSPTSEFLARWLYDQLEPFLLLLNAVEVEETCTSRCRYE